MPPIKLKLIVKPPAPFLSPSPSPSPSLSALALVSVAAPPTDLKPNFFTTAKGKMIDLNTLHPDTPLPSIEAITTHIIQTRSRTRRLEQAQLWQDTREAINQMCREKQDRYNCGLGPLRPRKKIVIITPLQRKLSGSRSDSKNVGKKTGKKAVGGKGGRVNKMKVEHRKINWKVYSSSLGQSP